MGALAQLASGREVARSSSDFATFTLDEFGAFLQQNGMLFQSSLQTKVERVENSFPGLLSRAYKANSAIFALEVVRFLLFSEARFQWRQLRNGRPGDLFGTQELALLEKPWPKATTGDMLARLLLYADFAGNAFAVRRMSSTGPVIRLPRPDWMTIIVGLPDEVLTEFEPTVPFWDMDAELIGYQYHPGGIGVGKPVNLLPETVAHFAPIPDPGARFIGMSIWRPAISNIEADSAATAMTLAYFENGATPGTVVTVNNPAIVTPDDFRTWIDLFESEHKGSTNRYKTLYLANGVDTHVVGSNLQEADLSKTQGATQTILAAVAGIHPALAGFSEGLGGSSLNKGNIQELKRLAAEKTFRPLWRNVAGSLADLLNVPGGSELWYDDRDIKFLAEDVKEAADIRAVDAQSIKALTDAGYESQSVIDAITSGDWSRLVHTGLFSVQLQAPGSTKMPVGEVPGQRPETGGKGPVTIPAGDTSTKQLTTGSNGHVLPGPLPARAFRARSTFWTSDGFMRGTIVEGTLVRADDPWVDHFPSMFEPSEVELPVLVTVLPQLALLSPRTEQTGDSVRCSNTDCGKLIAEAFVGDYYRGTCRYCKTVTEIRGSRELVRSDDMTRFLVEAQRSQTELLVALASRSETPPQINIENHPPALTFAEGAFRFEGQAPSQVTFEAGAFHNEVHAPEPAQVHIAKGAMQVNVEPSPVTIEKGAVNVEVHAPEPAAAPNVTVEAPPPAEVHINIEPPPPAVTNVTVEPSPPANVTIEKGAVQVAAAQVSVAPAAITVQAPPPAQVNVTLEAPVPMALVLDKDPETGDVTGEHQVPVDE